MSTIVDGGANNSQSSASDAIARCWPRKPPPPVMSMNRLRRGDQRTQRAYGVPLPLVPAPLAAAVARHPHLGTSLPTGWVRVDMHSHTMWSGDSTTTPDEIAAAVTESGIDVLCITDHNAIKGAVDLVGTLVVSRDRGGGAAHARRRDHRPVPRRADPGWCATGRRGQSHSTPGWRGVHPAPVRPDAPQHQRSGA